MKRILLALAILGLSTTGAFADPANLAGGVLITHYVEALGYSSDPPALGWCGEYLANHQILDASEQVTRIDTQSYLAASWFVIAAWDEAKVWCGTELGLGDYNSGLFSILEWSACYPPDGGLEIPTSNWPGPNEGIAFVVTGAAWEGNYLPVMYFGGYAYGNAGEGQIPLALDPPTSFAGFSNCAAPPEPYDADALGALGINMDGIAVAPPTAPRGACCIGPDCTILPEDDCLAGGGEWLGPNAGCDPNPCTVTPTNTTSWGSIKSMYR